MTPTPSQTVGPFFGFALSGVDDSEGVRVEGRLLDGAGEAVADGLLEVCAGERFARCRTDEEGAFHFTAPETGFLSITVFARGLLRQLNTRMYLPGTQDEVLTGIDPARRHTLIARREGHVLRFDIHLQGPAETVFFL